MHVGKSKRTEPCNPSDTQSPPGCRTNYCRGTIHASSLEVLRALQGDQSRLFAPSYHRIDTLTGGRLMCYESANTQECTRKGIGPSKPRTIEESFQSQRQRQFAKPSLEWH